MPVARTVEDLGGQPPCVAAAELRLGALLAEGGEGRVFEVASLRGADGAGLVYKQLRQPRAMSELSATVSFLQRLEALDPGLAARVRSSCAWPCALVAGERPDMAAGVLLPRAPRRFSACHRDGVPRLSTLSYLASDPDRITVAYGTAVPAPGDPARVAVVYALSRLLEAWQPERLGIPELVVHGDLSAKNVLWSVEPVPAVYVLDCDGASLVAAQGAGWEGGSCSADQGGEARGDGAGGSGRPTTPNWEDPALGFGPAASVYSDRYVLGLVFLRVVGAAHFPLQARQRNGARVKVDLELPRSWRRLPDMPGLWDLCERSLSVVAAEGRPSPSEWAAALEELLGLMGAGDLAAQSRCAQGDARPSAGTFVPSGPGSLLSLSAGGPSASEQPVGVRDVEVTPVLRHRVAPTWRLVDARAPAGVGPGLEGLGLATGLSPRQVLRRCGEAWAGAHQLAWRLLFSRGRRRHGLRRLAGVLVLDLAGACLVLFVAGMIVSPWIGL